MAQISNAFDKGEFAEGTAHAEGATPPATAPLEGWRVTLNSATIEDIVINAHDQVDEPSIAQLLDAFVFYVDNDEFILL
ncbi:hypothetical protein [Burkholderia vietnamiensis]|uniref:DUF7716 domain-containing protein n=1 Tax=Burkholderia vietnamiensis TaxID=60552 RepID=UPI000AB0C039|nr:hypothetical protein [Burkholderia vietnamiensis]